nr:uncharacterized protein LOC123765258 isoform X2 [Procambarus clarkii]XP_045609727.1 uncharacterized protein LOC123765258 isoform X2 [Procambarus clarkii]
MQVVACKWCGTGVMASKRDTLVTQTWPPCCTWGWRVAPPPPSLCYTHWEWCGRRQVATPFSCGLMLLLLLLLLQPYVSCGSVNHNSGRPAGTKIILERDVFNVIEERRESIINVTINPARVLTDKSKNFTSNWADSQSKVLNAKEFFTSLTVKNFTPVDKEQTNVFSSVIGKIVHDSVTAEKKSPISHIESSIAGKNATVNEDDTDQVQSDLKEKMAKDHILDVQEDGQILKEKHTEHHENVKPSAKGIVEEVDTEVKSDQPPEVKNEAYPKNVTDSEEVSEMRTGEVTETGKPVEKKIKHEKEPTNTTKMDAKPGEATEEKIKMVQTASGVSSESVKPEDKLEEVNKKIPDTEKSNEKDKDSMGKLPEPEKPQDMLETYSQFTQRVNAEKKNDVASNGHGGNGHGKGPKVKSKNYASPDCGSKLMLANPEASHSSKVIQSNKDEYMLNKCRDKIWFIIELCESIRPQKFDIANFELFSNLPKDIQVSGSHRYPTRDWTNLSRTVGQEGNRGVQSFPIDTEDFFKYIKVEVLSHYGSEFFCPLSLFRIYGLSEFEVIDTIEDSTDHDESEEAFGDPFEEEEAVDKFKDEGKPSVIPTVLKNMFSGVLDVIKRGYRPHSSASEPGDHCYSLHPKFAVDKSRCSMAESLNYILSCYWTEYEALMQKPVVSSTVKNSSFCRQLASTMCLEPGVNDSIVYDTVCNSSYVCVMLSPKHILAMCYMHDNRIMDAAVECDSSSTHMSENFSATSSDIIPSSDEIPSYVKNAKINTSRITRADALDSNASGTFDVQGTRLARDLESGQVLVEQEFHKANESIVPASTSESSTSETSKPPKKSKSNSSGHKGKSIKEVDQKDDITEPEEKLEADISSFGGIELEEVEFQQGEELTTPQPAPVAQPPAESKVSSTSPTNKESVVVRLSNKIKALEYNMSISSQYLEELSRRYKRQMEEMQKQFNLTIAALNATSWQAYQRDQQHQKDIETLENQLATVGNILKKLVDEQANLAHTVVEQHLLLMVVEVFVLCVVFFLCSRRSSRHMQQINTLKQKRREQIPRENPSELSACQDSGCHVYNDRGKSYVRRRSVDSITRERASRQRQRRPSEEALNISGTYQDLLIIEPAIPIMVDSTSDRKKSKKKSSNGTLKRSKSNASIVDKVSSSRRSRHIEKLNISSAGVLFCGDNTVEKDATPPPNNCLSSPDSPDFSGFPYEPFVNEQDQAVIFSGDDYGTYATRSYVTDVTEITPDRQFVNNTDIVASKRHSIASIQICDTLNKKGTKLSKSSLGCNATVKLKSSGEKVKKIKKVKKLKNIVTENLRNGLSQSHCPEALYEHDHYYHHPTTNGTFYNCSSKQHGEYYYGGRTSVHFSDGNHTSHELHYTGEALSRESFLNGDSSVVRQDYIGNDCMNSNCDKSVNERKKLSPMTKTKVKLRSDNWEWYSAQHFGSSSSETISTCSDSSGRNRKTKTEKDLLIVEKSEKKIKKKKSKSKAPIVVEEEIIPETDAGT